MPAQPPVTATSRYRSDRSNFPFGVGMSNLGNIGFFAPRFVRSDNYVIGARVGSVTNWTFSRQPWAMSLHCTSDKAKGWQH